MMMMMKMMMIDFYIDNNRLSDYIYSNYITIVTLLYKLLRCNLTYIVGENTNTPGLTGEERRNALVKRLIHAAYR